jgi:DNA-binding protein HU-beta
VAVEENFVPGGHVPNKAQFVEALAERFDGDKKRAAAALDAVIDTVYSAISRGERVALTGFGIFERRERAARLARNPATGATVRVKKTAVPAFKAGAEFKAIASGARKVAAHPVKSAQAAAATAAGTAKKAAAAATKSGPARKSAAKKSAAKKAPAKKAVAKKSPAKKAAAKKAAAKKSPAKKSAAKKASR